MMKSIQLSPIMALLASLQIVNCWLNETYSKTSFSATSVLSSKVSSSLSSSITPKPTYCGNCTLYYEVHAHIWWSTIFTTWAATWFYTVDKDSGSTIGSSLQYPLNTTAVIYPNFTQYIMNRDGGAIEYTTLNTLKASELTTIIAENTISMTGPANVYIVSTKYYNQTLSQTVCKGGAIYYQGLPTTGTAYNASKTISTVSGVPASTTYTYTTSAFNYGSNWTLAVPLAYGLDSLATAVGSVLSLTSACVIGQGGGVGTLKVGVTALTTSSHVYVNAQAVSTTSTGPIIVVPTPTPTPTQSTAEVKTPASLSDSVVVLPIYTPSTIIAQPVSTAIPTLSLGIVTTLYVTTSGSGGLETLAITTTLPSGSTLLVGSGSGSGSGLGSYTTTFVETISGSLGIETLAVTATLPIGSVLGSYTTTLIKTTQGAGGTGSQTLSQVVTLPVASYILSFLGVPGATTTNSGTTTTTTTRSAGSTGTGSMVPAQITGGSRRMVPNAWGLGTIAALLMLRVLI